MMNQQNQPQEKNFDASFAKKSAEGLKKRNTKDIQKMIDKMKDNHDTSVQLQISYEDACEHYRYYKSRTLKANVNESNFKCNEPDFKQNMEFREFFLGIKKRYDMQMRAQKFR